MEINKTVLHIVLMKKEFVHIAIKSPASNCSTDGGGGGGLVHSTRPISRCSK